MKVWRAEPSLRVDVVAGTTTATLLLTSCGQLLLLDNRGEAIVPPGGASPDEAVPAPFDVAPANLFSATLHTLATDTASYDVRSAPVVAASGPRRLENLRRTVLRRHQQRLRLAIADASPATRGGTVPSGRYCFTSAGVLAAAKYPSGNTITLTALQTSTPAPDAFKPYAKPTPLPS